MVAANIIISGIVQGVGFRPFVYALAQKHGIFGTVRNVGSMVVIDAYACSKESDEVNEKRLQQFIEEVSMGTIHSVVDCVTVTHIEEDGISVYPRSFSISQSSVGTGARSGFIPPDIATCPDCLLEIYGDTRYAGYFATTCVDCGPRYSVISGMPYDRVETAMKAFPLCPMCEAEYLDPHARRHHAQSISCPVCGPQLFLLSGTGEVIVSSHPIAETAALLDAGAIVAIRGNGGFHIACIEEKADELKRCLGRSTQALAIMATESTIETLAYVSSDEWSLLRSPAAPIVVLVRRDLSPRPSTMLHTIGCMLPYTGLHHLLFSHLKHPFLIMTSANAPGTPMVTENSDAIKRLSGIVTHILTHNRDIVNRCDDSVVRDGFLLRLSRGYAPFRVKTKLGDQAILGVGPELNANVTVYQQQFCVTSPHIGNIRNPETLSYHRETIERLSTLLSFSPDCVAHDAHPSFLTTRYAKELAKECDIPAISVQHHRAHIIAAAGPDAIEKDCIVGIALDGTGYGDDGTVWGGEIFSGHILDLKRVGHLEPVILPGGDLASEFPERLLYGFLPRDLVHDLLIERGFAAHDLLLIEKQIERGINVPRSSSAGRVLDAVSALLGVCTHKTYDGEPAMRLETHAYGARYQDLELQFSKKGKCTELLTSSLLNQAYTMSRSGISSPSIAASVQHALASGISHIATLAAHQDGATSVYLSGGVFYNAAIREGVIRELTHAGLECVLNQQYPLGDGCISYGQCVYAGLLGKEGLWE
ncbi:MAG: carbamoyltransferase HypF [Methanomicrobiales archaeon]|nr:carbamoyltransferase HypF [Methanomicrobiales archaeon]